MEPTSREHRRMRMRLVSMTLLAALAPACLVGCGDTTSASDAASEPSEVVPSELDCRGSEREVFAAPFFNEEAEGAETPQEAVDSWLGTSLATPRFGPESEYVMDEGTGDAWLLSADGTAVGRVHTKLTSGGGYFYYGHEACAD